MIRVGILTVSDSCAADLRQDKSGRLVQSLLKKQLSAYAEDHGCKDADECNKNSSASARCRQNVPLLRRTDLAEARRAPFKICKYEVIPDEKNIIKSKLKYYVDNLKLDLIFTTGGTGFGLCDVTPEATLEVAERIIPGIPELMRLEGYKKNKKTFLSRAVAVLRNKSIIINLPGSPKAVKESLPIILDIIPHAIEMIEGKGHKESR